MGAQPICPEIAEAHRPEVEPSAPYRVDGHLRAVSRRCSFLRGIPNHRRAGRLNGRLLGENPAVSPTGGASPRIGLSSLRTAMTTRTDVGSPPQIFAQGPGPGPLRVSLNRLWRGVTAPVS